MKRIITIFLLLTMTVFYAAGCKSRERAPEPSSESESSESEAFLEPTSSQAAEFNAAIKPSDVHIIQFDDPDPGDPIAVLTTTEGVIHIRLFPGQAEKTVTSFTRLANEGFYDGRKFATIVDGYKIETESDNPDADQNAGFPEEPECSLDLWNFRGAVTFAGHGADFMIVEAKQCLNPEEDLWGINFPQKIIEKYLEVGGAPHQDGKNTVFGAVISGMDIVDKIASAPAGEDGKPLEPVSIIKIEIETAE